MHDPAAAAADTSTGASNASRNFQIAAPFAWNRLIQAQGFGQRYEDADGNTLGTVSISANAISRYITVRVPKATLGQPASGWGFTVVLHGQDGFSGDQARGFQPTPGGLPVRGVRRGQPRCRTARPDPARSRSSWT